jgi:hypothetical protein
MLDLTTLELIPRELFVSKVLALPDCMIIGCNTAGAGVLQFYPVRLGIGKNYARLRSQSLQTEVQEPAGWCVKKRQAIKDFERGADRVMRNLSVDRSSLVAEMPDSGK